MNKALVAFNIGEEPISAGMNILGAHIDSPRLDIKQNPLYEETGLVLLDTHYYGGIKKYQWVALPKAMHGVIVKKDGTVVNVTIGEDEEDPVLYITDLFFNFFVLFFTWYALFLFSNKMFNLRRKRCIIIYHRWWSRT